MPPTDVSKLPANTCQFSTNYWWTVTTKVRESELNSSGFVCS